MSAISTANSKQGSWVKRPGEPGLYWKPNPDYRAPESSEAEKREREERWRQVREKEEAERGAEQAEIEALADESVIDFDSARLLHTHRKSNVWMPDHELEFCEALEKRHAAQKAERVVSGNGYVDWDAHDRKLRTGADGTNERWARPHERPDTISEQHAKITATPFLVRNPKLIPPRDFRYDDHIIRRYVSGVVSMGGVGKTSEVQAEVAAMVTGRNLLGIKPKRPYRVWYINLEDPTRSSAAWQQSSSITTSPSKTSASAYSRIPAVRKIS